LITIAGKLYSDLDICGISSGEATILRFLSAHYRDLCIKPIRKSSPHIVGVTYISQPMYWHSLWSHRNWKWYFRMPKRIKIHRL